MNLFSTSKKTAIIWSYIGIASQALATFFLTRYYLGRLGEDAYGLYQMINSVAQYILILDLGIGTVMVRYITEFITKDDIVKTENFSFHFGLIVIAVSIVIVIISCILNVNIEKIYRTLTLDEYSLAHKMFSFITVQLVATVVGHFFQGLFLAYDQYTFEHILGFVKTVLNLILTVIFISLSFGILGIVLANSVSILLHTLVCAGYAFRTIKFKIRFHFWDLQMLRPAFLLMVAMLLQSVVGHVNGSVDKTILGIMATKSDVAVYSIAATIITMFNTIPTAISGVFQPDAVRLVAKNADGEAMTDFVIKPGRIQFMLVGGFIAGFFLFGKDFIICWTGKTTMTAAWLYVLVIMLPNAVPLIQTPCLSLLNALDKRIYRSIILVCLTIINILLTVLFIKMIGPVGAPMATGISYLIGHVILMNIYYWNKIGLNVFRMFRGILNRTSVCVLLALLINLPLMLWQKTGNWAVLIIKAIAFCLVYALLLIKYAFNSGELEMLHEIFNKLHIHIKKG